jgi:hypothetical protein
MKNNDNVINFPQKHVMTVGIGGVSEDCPSNDIFKYDNTSCEPLTEEEERELSELNSKYDDDNSYITQPYMVSGLCLCEEEDGKQWRGFGDFYYGNQNDCLKWAYYSNRKYNCNKKCIDANMPLKYKGSAICSVNRNPDYMKFDESDE